MVRYTKTEKTKSEFTRDKALANADIILGKKGIPVCTNAYHRVSPNRMLTLVEVNNLVSDIVSDSLYYHYG